MTDGGENPPVMIGEKNPMYGKTHSNETKIKFKEYGKLVLDTSSGIYYSSLKQAAEAHYPQVKYATIKCWLNPNRRPYKNPSNLRYV